MSWNFTAYLVDTIHTRNNRLLPTTRTYDNRPDKKITSFDIFIVNVWLLNPDKLISD